MNLFFFFLLLFTLLPLAAAVDCLRSCGPTNVLYPFGFSGASCDIPLSCSSAGTIKLRSFVVRNVTSDRLLVQVPPSCDRAVESTKDFFGPNFALTHRNSLLLRSCSGADNSSTTAAACSISPELLNRTRCAPNKNDSVSCYPTTTPGGNELLSSDQLSSTTACKSLFTVAVYEVETAAGDLTSIALAEAELGWWLEGDCRCSEHAYCTRLRSPVTGNRAFRCKCNEGYQGDGFAGDGAVGCTKVSTCGSSSYVTGSCGGSSSKIVVLIGGIIAGGAIMAVVAAALCFFRSRRASSRSRKGTRRLLSEASFNVPFYPYKVIERATENFSDTHRLGTGAYGTVYVGHLTNGELVAVKRIKHPEPETVEQVVNEVKIISSVNHPNLVRLLGCCIDHGEQILVYEFMPNGTLAQHLQRQRGPGLPWTVRLSIATGTAKAIAYLHSVVHPPIYHRDIKSSNILLDHQFNAKIADFGLSRAIATDLSHVSTAPQGTPGYVDPQYHQNYHLSDKSDVYSFGVVLMEMITGLKVVDFNRAHAEVNLAALAVDRIAKGRVDEIIDPLLKAPKDSWTSASIHKVAELAFRCLAFHRDMRPSMMEVADELEQVRLSCWVPKDGDVVVPGTIELCSSPLIMESKRIVVVSKRVEEKEAESPVSVQEQWGSDHSNPSSNSLLGYPSSVTQSSSSTQRRTV